MRVLSRRIERLPPYIFHEVNALKMKLRRQGVDIIDLGMGNPDQPTPSHIVDKMVEGRLRNYYAERVLLEQAFVKEQKQTVGQYAKENGMEVNQFIHWVLGE